MVRPSAPSGIAPHASQQTSQAASASRGPRRGRPRNHQPRERKQGGAAVDHRPVPLFGRGCPLQRADVGRDRPAIGRRHPVGIAVHHAVAVGDHVDKMLVRRRDEPRIVELGGRGKPRWTTIPSASPPSPWHRAEDFRTAPARAGPARRSSAGARQGHCPCGPRARRCPAPAPEPRARCGTGPTVPTRRPWAGRSS